MWHLNMDLYLQKKTPNEIQRYLNFFYLDLLARIRFILKVFVL